jgi:hypothetical protein
MTQAPIARDVPDPEKIASPAAGPSGVAAQAITPKARVVGAVRDEERALVSAPVRPSNQAPVSSQGTLEINAQIPVDVYFREAYVGSTPVKFQLASGIQTLEFRYQDLRKTGSYVVKSNETLVATVVFEVMVQVNANPWAEVFIDASEPKRLGETPLSRMPLPVGSVLVFKNPKFPEKRYRVTGKEASIHMVFP